MSSDTSKARAARTKKADDFASIYYEKIKIAVNKGVSYRKIAQFLNSKGIPTPSGQGMWHGVQVKRILERIEHGT